MKKNSPQKVVMYWTRLPTEQAESLSLEVSKKHADVALKDMVNVHGGE